MQIEQLMESMKQTFCERQKIYGDNWQHIGRIMKVLYPDGLSIKTAEEWNRFHLFFQILIKLTRLVNSQLNHKDSAHDIAVYGVMLESLCNNPITDADRLEAIAGLQLHGNSEFKDGKWTDDWVCIWDGKNTVTGNTIREAIDVAIKLKKEQNENHNT